MEAGLSGKDRSFKLLASSGEEGCKNGDRT